MQDKQGSMLLAHNVVGCLLPFIFCSGGGGNDGHIRLNGHIRHDGQ